MADTSTSSQVVTDLDASPVVKTNPLAIGGVVGEAIAHLALDITAAAGEAGTVWRMTRLPARARVVKLELANDALDDVADLAVDIGLYEVDGGAAKDADFFAAAITNLQTAQTAWQDETYESAVVDVEDYHKPLWEQLGDSDTPENRGKFYDVALTVTTDAATAAAGDILLKVQYVVDE
jgi:hypothetical protein